MTVLSTMVDALFDDPNLSRAALYTPLSGSPQTIRIMVNAPDIVTTFGDASLHSTTLLVDIRISDVPQPQAGDTLYIDGITHTVQGEPLADRERLIWTLDCCQS